MKLFISGFFLFKRQIIIILFLFITVFAFCESVDLVFNEEDNDSNHSTIVKSIFTVINGFNNEDVRSYSSAHRLLDTSKFNVKEYSESGLKKISINKIFKYGEITFNCQELTYQNGILVKYQVFIDAISTINEINSFIQSTTGINLNPISENHFSSKINGDCLELYKTTLNSENQIIINWSSSDYKSQSYDTDITSSYLEKYIGGELSHTYSAVILFFGALSCQNISLSFSFSMIKNTNQLNHLGFKYSFTSAFLFIMGYMPYNFSFDNTFSFVYKRGLISKCRFVFENGALFSLDILINGLFLFGPGYELFVGFDKLFNRHFLFGFGVIFSIKAYFMKNAFFAPLLSIGVKFRWQVARIAADLIN